MTVPARDPLRARRVAMTLVVIALALALDLWTKAWAWDNLRGEPARALLDGVLYLEFSFNTGSAFGLFGGEDFARPLFITVTIITVLYMAALLRGLPTRRPFAFAAIGLIIAGALGNAHDRFVRALELGGELRHGVVDFILVYYLPNRPWPNFNVADIALVIGVGLLLPYLLRHGDELAEAVPASA